MEIELKEIVLKPDVIEDFQQSENEMIINTFLNNIENNIVEYKTHPTATMILVMVWDFLNIGDGDGDCMEFQKYCFQKVI